jgi:hypothetical protein
MNTKIIDRFSPDYGEVVSSPVGSEPSVSRFYASQSEDNTAISVDGYISAGLRRRHYRLSSTEVDLKPSFAAVGRRAMRPLVVLLFVALCVGGAARTATRQTAAGAAAPLDLSRYDLRPFYENDFSRPQKIAREEDLIEQVGAVWRRKSSPPPDAEWIAEGWGGVEVRDGRLRVSPSPFDASGRPIPVESARRSHMVIWNRRIFPADFLLEFEMSPCGSANGLTIVLFSAAGQNGEDIFDLSLPPRRAEYQAYHSGAVVNYTDSYWSRNNEAESLSNRLRKNPGFKQVAEGPSLTTGPTDVTHRLRILKIGPHIEVEVNGKVVIKWDDPERPHGAGRIGLRSMEGVTMVAYDKFKVWQVTAKRT